MEIFSGSNISERVKGSQPRVPQCECASGFHTRPRNAAGQIRKDLGRAEPHLIEPNPSRFESVTQSNCQRSDLPSKE